MAARPDAGSGWGLIDAGGEPKVAYHHLRRALAPVATWLVDEGLAGVDVHVANDRPEPLRATLRVATYRDGAERVEEGEAELELPGHGAHTIGVEALLGRFVDASWAYRFGPPAQDVIVATLERAGGAGPELLSQAFCFPAGRPTARRALDELGLTAEVAPEPDGRLALTVGSRRLAYGVRAHVPGFSVSDDAFSIEPGGERLVWLQGAPGAEFRGGAVTALNLEGRLRLAADGSA